MIVERGKACRLAGKLPPNQNLGLSSVSEGK